MQIPGYWAECRLEGEVAGRARVVRRFGWSDDSAEHAERHARERAEAALADLRLGRAVAGRERKLAYGGAGLPIREEVVARNGDDVVTRNSYGARCLNEPDVLFADLDLDFGPGTVYGLLVFVESALLSASVWALFEHGCARVLLGVLAPLVIAIWRILATIERNERRHRRRFERRMRDRVEQVVRRHPGMLAALYETPRGMRVLMLHRTYDPASEGTARLFAELRTDPAYAQMCALQACFRARVSPKPWRIELGRPPTSAVWPVPEDRRAERDAWVAEYEQRAAGFAACRFVAELGDGRPEPRCLDVQRMHDELSRARTDLPIA